MRRLALAAGLALTVIVVGACSAPSGGDAAPDVTFQTLDDASIRLADRRGSPTLIVFFSLNNPLALGEIDRLMPLLDDYADLGLELVCVARSDDRPELVRTVVHHNGYLTPFAMDPDNRLAKAFGAVGATPAVFLVSPDGRMVFSHTGALDLHELRGKIDSAP
jgi:peroxiredoxin